MNKRKIHLIPFCIASEVTGHFFVLLNTWQSTWASRGEGKMLNRHLLPADSDKILRAVFLLSTMGNKVLTHWPCCHHRPLITISICVHTFKPVKTVQGLALEFGVFHWLAVCDPETQSTRRAPIIDSIAAFHHTLSLNQNTEISHTSVAEY